MSSQQYEIFFLVLAAFVGGVGLLPALTKYKPRLLGSAVCLLTCAFALFASGDNAPLTCGTLDRPMAMQTVFKIAFWIAAALLGAVLMNFVFSRWIFPERGRPKRRKLFADLSVGLMYFIAGAGILDAILVLRSMVFWRHPASLLSLLDSRFKAHRQTYLLVSP